MRGPASLQGRLSLTLGAVLLWTVAAVLIAAHLSHEMNEVFDSALEETGQRLLPLAVHAIVGREDDDSPDQDVATLRKHDEYFTYVVRDVAGQMLLRSHRADPKVFPPFSGMGFAETATHRIYSDAALKGSITISVAEPLARRQAVAREALIGLAPPLALIVPASLIGVWPRSTPPWRRSGAFAKASRRAAGAICRRSRPKDCRPSSGPMPAR